MGAGLAVGPVVGGMLVEWGWPGSSRSARRSPLAVGLAALVLLPRLARGRAVAAPAARGVAAPARAPVAALAGLASWAQFAVWLLAPFYIVTMLGLPARHGGLVFVLTCLGTALGAPVSGWITDRRGARAPMIAGLMVEAAGLAALAACDAGTPVPRSAPRSSWSASASGLSRCPTSPR